MNLEQLNKRKNLWRNTAIGLLGLMLALVAYFFTATKNSTSSFSPTDTFNADSLSNQIQIDDANKISGRCLNSLPQPVTDSNFVKLVFSLKGKELHIMDFEWNNRDYVSGPGGCIKTNSDNTEHTMAMFIPQSGAEDIIPLFTRIRSDIAGGNEYEISLKAFNLKNELIGKYPEEGDSFKGKILAIALPAIIKTNIKLKR